MFGEGYAINFYDNVNCTGTESSLNDCRPPYTPSSQNCGYAGVFCPSTSNFRFMHFWFGRLVVIVACAHILTVTVDFSETRETSGSPLPTSTVVQPNHATSSKSGIMYTSMH